MPETWWGALKAYSYPVDLSRFERATDFPRFFQKVIRGDRITTMAFEDYFRAKAPTEVEVWYEVLFWKLFSQPNVRQGHTNRVVNHVQEEGITASSLWMATQNFTKAPNKANLEEIRSLLGLKTKVLAVPLTFVAFAMPSRFPMIDRNVAHWVNKNMLAHNAHRRHTLTAFKMDRITFQDNDFVSYLNWVFWCQDVADILASRTDVVWRARDVEMAVFTSYGKGLSLSVLP